MKLKSPPSSHALVLLQFLGIALACYPVGWTNRGPALALILCFLGSVWGIYALMHNKIGNFSVYPELKSNTMLITSGPYAIIRHPMYTALMVMMTGIAVYNHDQSNYVGVVLVCVAVVLKAQAEEQYLEMRFPEYSKYKTGTAKFFPFLNSLR